MEVCKRSHRAHQLKQCTPTFVEHLKCSVKLCGVGARAGRPARELSPFPPPLPPPPRRARAVDVLCRPQFASLAACLKGAAGDVSKCVPAVTAFDVCTEEW
jgi:hypothetical protein